MWTWCRWSTRRIRPNLFGLSLPAPWRALGDIGEWRRQRTGRLTTNFAEAGGFFRSQPGEPVPDIQLHFVIGKLVDHGRKTVFGHGYSCHVCLLHPQSRGSVTLDSADPLAPPRIDPAFLADPDDLARMVRGFQRMRQILAQPALAALGGRELPASAGAQTEARSPTSSASTPTPSTTRWAAAAWAPARWTWWTPSCGCTACRGCG
jgi:choline dehydrogenase-like flavoprotein